GMGAGTLSLRVGRSRTEAGYLLDSHKAAYPDYWRWNRSAIDHAMFLGELPTVFGWTTHVGSDPNPRSLGNFCSQANGSEMLRLACIIATELGVKVDAPVHDALLIEAPIEDLADQIATTQAAMAQASKIVLDGFELRTDAKQVVYPGRFEDPRGR